MGSCRFTQPIMPKNLNLSIITYRPLLPSWTFTWPLFNFYSRTCQVIDSTPNDCRIIESMKEYSWSCWRTKFALVNNCMNSSRSRTDVSRNIYHIIIHRLNKNSFIQIFYWVLYLCIQLFLWYVCLHQLLQREHERVRN